MHKKRRYTIVVMPQSNGTIRKFSVSIFGLILTLSLFVLIGLTAIGGIIWATSLNQKNINFWNEYQRLYSNYDKQKNELERLGTEIEKARKREQIIRNVLGIEGYQNDSGYGQGGTGYEHINSNSNRIPAKPLSFSDANADDVEVGTLENRSYSYSEKINLLNLNLEQLLAQIEKKKLELSQTPSVRPLMTSDYWYSDYFRWRRHPMTGAYQFHPALDISAKLGTPVVAAADGRVNSISYDSLLGLNIRIQHNSLYSTGYAHLLSVANNLKAGSYVRRNQPIGYVGISGRTTGPHLHYEVWFNNKPDDPLKYILN